MVLIVDVFCLNTLKITLLHLILNFYDEFFGLTSTGFDVTGGGQICFDFAYAVQGQPSPTEGPD